MPSVSDFLPSEDFAGGTWLVTCCFSLSPIDVVLVIIAKEQKLITAPPEQCSSATVADQPPGP